MEIIQKSFASAKLKNSIKKVFQQFHVHRASAKKSQNMHYPTIAAQECKMITENTNGMKTLKCSTKPIKCTPKA